MTDDPVQMATARRFAAEPFRNLAAELRLGAIRCNDPAAMLAETEQAVAEIEAGQSDHIFSVWQRMHLFLTGECVPLLSPVAVAEQSAKRSPRHAQLELL